MHPIPSIAANVQATQSQGLEAAPPPAASPVTVRPADSPLAAPGSAVRIGDLPAGGPILSVVTLAEVQSAYRLNAPEETPSSGMLVPLGYVFD